MNDLRVGHKKNDRLVFGKTNPIGAEEGASRPFRLGGGDFPKLRIRAEEKARDENRLQDDWLHEVEPERPWSGSRENTRTTKGHRERRSSEMCDHPPVSSYSSRVELALSLKSELEAYEKDKDRRPLINALREQFLVNRNAAACQAEIVRDAALRVLFARMEHMSDNMLLRMIRELTEMGALELTAVTGIAMPEARTPMVFGLAGRGSQRPLSDRSDRGNGIVGSPKRRKPGNAR
jgi:hypothetical protein